MDPEKNSWQVVLTNGTRIFGVIEDKGLELKPSMGPDQVEVSWKLISRLEPAAMTAPVAMQSSGQPYSTQPSDMEYYSNEYQRAEKMRASDSWR